MLPNKPRGVPRVNDRRVLNGIFWVLRSGARDLPQEFGPYTTCYDRFVRWQRANAARRWSLTRSPRSRRTFSPTAFPEDLTSGGAPRDEQQRASSYRSLDAHP
jgi:transposase